MSISRGAIFKPVLVSALLLTSGCAGTRQTLDQTLGIGSSINTGQIDYRVAEPFPVTEQLLEAHNTDDPLAPARLKRKFSLPRFGFPADITDSAKKDVYSISLDQAMFGDWVSEVALAYPAEIAILANAFEFDANGNGNPTQRFYDFPEIANQSTVEAKAGETLPENGLKLIYFSPDIFANQPANFAALPIIPPSKYNGRPIGIQIVILELDRLSGPLKSLLDTLADIGQASNIATATPGVGDTVLELGRSLLDGNSDKDDILFEYRMVLNPKGFSANAQDSSGIVNDTATFQPGRHVIRRTESRDTPMTWANLFLDHNTARLYTRKNNRYEEYRDDTYIVLNIQRHPAGTPEARYAFRTIADLNADLAAAASTNTDAALDAITRSLGTRINNTRSNAWLDSVLNRWASTQEAALAYDLHRFPPGTPSTDQTLERTGTEQCNLINEEILRQARVLKEIGVKNAADNFVAEYQRANAAKREDESGGLTILQFEDSEKMQLISTLALFIVPKLSSAEPNFTDVSAFENTYITNQTGARLSGDLIAAMNTIPRKFSCSDLRNRGWVEEG